MENKDKQQNSNGHIADSQLEGAQTYLSKILGDSIDSDEDNPFVNKTIDTKVIFNKDDVKKVLSQQAKDSRLKPCLEAMLKEGDSRALALIDDDMLERLMLLADTFPNFTDIVIHYRNALLLESLSTLAPVYMPPILLVGEPGIGKTRFLRELAKVLGVDFYQVDMATTTAGFVLSGSSTSWGEGKPGFVTDSLRQSKVINPILLIDEIDKAMGGLYNPLGSLYTLLERDTAKTFKDEALTIAMDCSYINWVASANDVNAIPAALLSRMTLFNVKGPTLEQIPAIAQSVYKDLLNENTWGQRFCKTLDETVLQKLIVATPREMKRILTKAASEAVSSRRYQSDELLQIMVGDVVLGIHQEPNKRMGFL